MKESKELFDLIKKLSKNEKIYFKRFSMGIAGKENKYLMLFDEIEKQKIYNEDVVKENLNKTEYTQALHVVKKYLYNRILEALKIYDKSQHPTIEVINTRNEAEILIRKGLVFQATKKLLEAKEIALSGDLISECMQINTRLIDLSVFFQSKLYDKKELAKENYRLSVESKHISYFSLLYEDLLKIHRLKNNKLLSAVEKDKITIEKINKYTPLFNITRIEQLKCLTAFYIISDIPEKAYECQLQLIELFEKNPTLKENKIQEYVRALHNLSNTERLTNRHKEFDAITQKLEDLFNSDSPYSDHIKSIVYPSLIVNKLNSHINNKQKNELLKTVEFAEETYETYQNYVAYNRQFFIKFNLIKSYIYLNKFNNALLWLNTIDDTKKSDFDIISNYSYNLLKLICLYETGKFDLLALDVDKAKRVFKKLNQYDEFEKNIISIFKYILKTYDLTSDEVVPYTEKILANPKINLLKEVIDIRAWIIAHQNKKTIWECL
ncbi:MAG: hypothetical protein J0M08_03095 [Bacteroidetes bacterium]|nr:hypothetical protein [Bacteroidota bacterium]